MVLMIKYFFSYPLLVSESQVKIIDQLTLSDNSIRYIKESEKELISERDIIKDLL